MSPKIKWLAWGAIIILLVYTRFVNLSWGLPYPFHPDERNIANAVQSLSCDTRSMIYDLRSCLIPHFYAYGQLLIYLAYVLVLISRFVSKISGVIRFDEAVMALRFISATVSLATAFVMLNLIQHLTGSRIKSGMTMAGMLIVIFSPALIQFAHFGTTESLLMFFYTLLIYFCLKLNDLRLSKAVDSIYIWIGLISGLAIATKISSLLFVLLPFVTIIALPNNSKQESKYNLFWQKFNELIFVGFITGATAIIFSPYNLISWKDFVSSINYESMVATGKTLVFYTRTFSDSIPVYFQFQRIFPYVLGWPVFILFIFGFVILPWNRRFNILRFAFFIYFLPTAFLFSKWTRFIAPVLPVMIIITSVVISKVLSQISNPKLRSIILLFLIGITIIPGIVFLKVYTTQDVRFQASKWMMKNVPNNSFILQETANVIDLPLFLETWNVKHRTFKSISFNFYELDADKKLQEDLQQHIKNTDFIIVPSRRIYKNHSKKKYPLLNKYYDDLFSGKLGFYKVAEFKVLVDDDAEETWTVFDHPVIRIFKRI